MRFLYFIIGITGSPSREKCVAVSGLDYAFPAGESFTTREMNGALGAGVLAACGEGGPLEHNPETHDWSKISECVWLGMPRDKTQRPGPDDLARAERCLDGYPVMLGDGKKWNVPVIRFLFGNTQLPRFLTVVDGDVKWLVKPEFTELFAMAESLVQKVFVDGESESDPAAILRFCAMALGVNYRIGPYEVAALGLIDSENVRLISDAALDGPKLAILIDEKKKRIEHEAAGVILEAGASA